MAVYFTFFVRLFSLKQSIERQPRRFKHFLSLVQNVKIVIIWFHWKKNGGECNTVHPIFLYFPLSFCYFTVLFFHFLEAHFDEEFESKCSIFKISKIQRQNERKNEWKSLNNTLVSTNVWRLDKIMTIVSAKITITATFTRVGMFLKNQANAFIVWYFFIGLLSIVHQIFRLFDVWIFFGFWLHTIYFNNFTHTYNCSNEIFIELLINVCF